jgi:hypothetical protein
MAIALYLQNKAKQNKKQAASWMAYKLQIVQFVT